MSEWEFPRKILFIYPSYIGFGLPLLLLLYFYKVYKGYLNGKQLFLWMFAIYASTQLIASSLFELGYLKLRTAYYMAGFPIPLVLFLIAGKYIKWDYKRKKSPTDIDHFVNL